MTGSILTRLVLDGVPKVNFYEGGPRCPEDICFPSCLRAVLEYLGDERFCCRHSPASGKACEFRCTYAYLTGTSGAASMLNWRPGWHPDNGEITYMSDEPAAPFDHAFASIGYDYELVSPRQDGEDEAALKERIVESIRDKGRPVIGFGVVGPPEACLITRDDKGGDEGIGWSFLHGDDAFRAGVEFEPTGQFRKRGWFTDTHKIVLVGEKRDLPPLREVCRDALAWMLQVVRTPVTLGDHRNGLMAYAAWADHLLRDEDFDSDDMAVLRERFWAHDGAVGLVAEGRWYGSMFLADMVEHVPHAADEALLRAAACYAGEHDLMWKVWAQVGGIGHSDDHVKTLAQPEVRRRIVSLIFQARDKDAEAAMHIERALAQLQ